MSGGRPVHRMNRVSPDRGNAETFGPVRKVPSVTEPDYLRRTRTGYDLTASTYAERFHHHLRDKAAR